MSKPNPMKALSICSIKKMEASIFLQSYFLGKWKSSSGALVLTCKTSFNVSISSPEPLLFLCLASQSRPSHKNSFKFSYTLFYLFCALPFVFWENIEILKCFSRWREAPTFLLTILAAVYFTWLKNINNSQDMSHSQMLGKVESGGGPIFKVVLEC